MNKTKKIRTHLLYWFAIISALAFLGFYNTYSAVVNPNIYGLDISFDVQQLLWGANLFRVYFGNMTVPVTAVLFALFAYFSLCKRSLVALKRISIFAILYFSVDFLYDIQVICNGLTAVSFADGWINWFVAVIDAVYTVFAWVIYLVLINKAIKNPHDNSHTVGRRRWRKLAAYLQFICAFEAPLCMVNWELFGVLYNFSFVVFGLLMTVAAILLLLALWRLPDFATLSPEWVVPTVITVP